MTAMPAIAIAGLKKAFGRKVVLDGLDLSIEKGESLVVIGGSGSGKSVLLKCILGLLRPTAGSVKIDGEETVALKGAERDRIHRKFGMLFQGGALFDSLNVWRNVAFGVMAGQRMDDDEARQLALDNLAKVGLDAEIAEADPASLSGGMRKRVGLARAIATRPEILFFDEPTTGLDPVMGDLINNLILECVQELGATTLTITHDMSSARTIGHRVAMLYGGQIMWHGRAQDLDHSGNAHLDQFIHGRIEGPIATDPQ